MKNYTLKDFSEEVIRKCNTPLTTVEIWHHGKVWELDKKGGFVGKTP